MRFIVAGFDNPSDSSDRSAEKRTSVLPCDVNERHQVLVSYQADGEEGVSIVGVDEELSTKPLAENLTAEGFTVTPRAINDRGVAIGEFFSSPSDVQPFVTHEGRAVSLQRLVGSHLPKLQTAADVNNDLAIIGQVDTKGKAPIAYLILLQGQKFVHWTAENFVASAINDKGRVVGNCVGSEDQNADTTAALWNPGTPPCPLEKLSAGASSANDVNRDGFIAGWAEDREGTRHAVCWNPDGKIVDLGFVPGFSTEATAINNTGVVVGRAFSSKTLYLGLIWFDGQSYWLKDLTVLPSIPPKSMVGTSLLELISTNELSAEQLEILRNLSQKREAQVVPTSPLSLNDAGVIVGAARFGIDVNGLLLIPDSEES